MDIIEKVDGLTRQLAERDEQVAQAQAERDAAQAEKIEQLREESAELRQLFDGVQESLQSRRLSLPGVEESGERYSITRVARALQTGNFEQDAPYEWEVSQQTAKHNAEEVERRTMSGPTGTRAASGPMLVGTDTSGGFLVPEEVVQTFYDGYRPTTIRSTVGVMTLSPMGYPVKINKSTAHTEAYRHAEGAAWDESDVTFGQVTLQPKALSARSVISEENIRFTEPAVDSIVQRDLLRTLDLRQDRDLLFGNGSTEPTGVINAAGVNPTDLRAAGDTLLQLEWDDVLQLEGVIEDADALMADGSLYFVSHPGVFRGLRKQRAGGSAPNDGGYIVTPPQKLDDLMPWPKASTTAIQDSANVSDAKHIFFGRWSDVVHAQWGGMLLKRSDTATDGTYNGLTQNYVHLAVTIWDDANVIRGASITYSDQVSYQH